jgi:Uma2 family endonuclease
MTIIAPPEGAPVVKDDDPQLPLRMTYEEFLDWLDEDKHAEWVNGEVIVHSPVSRGHTSVGRFLLGILTHFVEENQAGELFYDPFQMKISVDSPGRAPDIMFVATVNLSRVKDNLLEGPADLIVEIVSPESRTRDRGEKFYEYEQGGVGEYWIVDPKRRQAEFYQRGDDSNFHPVLPDANGIYRSAILSGFWLDVDWLWQNPLPTLLTVLRAWGLVPPANPALP